MNLSANIQRLRKQCELTPIQLATATGLHHTTVKRILSHTRSGENTYNPSLSTLKKLKKYFELEGVDTLLNDKLEIVPVDPQ